MPTVSIRLSIEQKDALKAYAKANCITMSDALKGAFFSRMEDECDIKQANEILARYQKNPIALPAKDIFEKYGI